MNEPGRGSRVQRVRHEIKRRSVEVSHVEALSPGFKRITFTGDSLGDFVSASFDDHIKFVLDRADGEPVMRDYTPRSYSQASRELTIEFALHGDGPAADWAAQASPGQRVTIAGPRGSFVIPLDYAWHLFVGDETALPAVARRLEELPAGSRAFVLMHVANPKDRRSLETAADLSVQWADDTENLIAAVRQLALPPGEGYAWCAGEAAAMAQLRRLLVTDKGHHRHAIRAAAHWKQGAVAHHQNLED